MAVHKITLEELQAKIADATTPDSELQRFFILDQARSKPFSPALAFNPETVQIAKTPEEGQRSAELLNSANQLARLRRQFAFNSRIREGSYRGPILVSEGDSWFQYPFLLEDVIDQLMPKYAIYSLDAAGDTLSNMLKEKEYLKALTDIRASIFLFSGGGNDVVAGGNLAAHLRDFDDKLSPGAHLKPTFNTVLDEAIGLYSKLVREVAKGFQDVDILCHGYDYTIPADGPWLGKPMKSRGIEDTAFQAAIAKIMIDRFNERLLLLSKTSARLHYIDCRNTVGKAEWHDELHPTDAGYKKVASKFAAVIETLKSKPRSADTKPGKTRAIKSDPVGSTQASVKAKLRHPSASIAGGPNAISLHIGLDTVNPDHYAGWDGQLAACEFDANDMKEIADGLGYKSTLLLSAEATRKAVTDSIRKAAVQLKEGDIFFLSYSGHGSQMPDFNGDEEDGLDETWCLFDGQLLDDELYEAWSEFKFGVRVLVLSDSCHSGSVIRAFPAFTASIEQDQIIASEHPRVMPPNIASRTFRQNRAFYEELGSRMSSIELQATARAKQQPISCSVKLISGCQDNQVSMDGVGNGKFTGALIKAWDHGRFKGDYSTFRKTISKMLPETQSPNYWTIGSPNPVFDAQTPFAI
ncbi:caspase family protein [Rhizobium leguminosarum]|uniref:Peptidase C14, caspase catalytic subunit p20 n=1 Tax=Rhizobium leguminosarum TaxID=384 RepID=A0A7K3VL70_RHILE|nr:caspase family protein [Rhizobium leguminosarum]NEK17467.1 peptidase C14, caspase catalytic subunit p20 [Rhizobium leguminosarum]